MQCAPTAPKITLLVINGCKMDQVLEGIKTTSDSLHLAYAAAAAATDCRNPRRRCCLLLLRRLRRRRRTAGASSVTAAAAYLQVNDSAWTAASASPEQARCSLRVDCAQVTQGAGAPGPPNFLLTLAFGLRPLRKNGFDGTSQPTCDLPAAALLYGCRPGCCVRKTANQRLQGWRLDKGTSAHPQARWSCQCGNWARREALFPLVGSASTEQRSQNVCMLCRSARS